VIAAGQVISSHKVSFRRVGRWKSYRFGDKVHVMLSLLAKSALAWQVFPGTLAR